ncbi:MAG: DUF421 domain-containing protein [Oscillospiraceae bacterium]|nr:DUF421 domain-containing protein [Oscillospiraceae bacterium]
MELLHILLTSVASVILLFLLTKLLGNRQMSQLSMFDYINGITIGSIAAEMATSLEDDFLKPLLAMLVYAGISFAISFFTCKSIHLRRFVMGNALVLFYDGKIYEKNLLKAKIDLDDFLTQCRNNGYFNLSDIHAAILETNGKISFLPKEEKRPVNPSDLGICPKQQEIVSNMVMDGNIFDGNLKYRGKNREWLLKQLKSQDIKDLKEVLLATCDGDDNLSVYLKTKTKSDRDMFN